MSVTVIKNDHTGQEVWRYTGQVIERNPRFVKLEAYFQGSKAPVNVGPLTLEAGDRMVEWFYSERWYNIFEIHHHETDALKGWYCNITRPADTTDETIVADDLALDVIVTPEGEIVLDDEDEYEALPLTATEREATQAALTDLRQRIRQRRPPFDAIRVD